MSTEAKKPKVILLIIDPQVDFHPGGSLAIANANDDSERTASLILNNIDHIDEIVVTLDTHHVSSFSNLVSMSMMIMIMMFHS